MAMVVYTKTQKIVREVPNHFFDYDRTLRDRIVGAILADSHLETRSNLDHENGDYVESAINALTDAYEKADKIIDAVALFVLEQRCERNTPYDETIKMIVAQIRKQS